MRFLSVMLSLLLVSAMIVSPAQGADLEKTFISAPKDFSPVPIWWWSGDPITKKNMRDQLHKIANGGIYNVIILNLAPSGPLYGSAADEPPFLTDEWWDLFEYALKIGKETGVRIWFYDQLGFSGAGLQARVVRDNPEMGGINLKRVVRDVKGPIEFELDAPTGGEAIAAFISQPFNDTSAKIPTGSWIWSPDRREAKMRRAFRRAFNIDSLPSQAKLAITCDNGYVLYVNGNKIGEELTSKTSGWKYAEEFNVLPYLRKGKNVIAVEGIKLGGAAGLLLRLQFDGEKVKLVSDDEFLVSAHMPDGWTSVNYDDSKWKQARVIGDPPRKPWGTIYGITQHSDKYLGVQVKNVRNVSNNIDDNRVNLSIPAGAHRVSLFYTTAGGFDYQNPVICGALLDLVHGEMEKRFRNELGRTIAGSFQDEFPRLPRFSRRMPEEFIKRKGYDLMERLPALYDDVIDNFGDNNGPSTIQIRCAASEVAAQLCEEAFFIPLHQWHEKYNMLCGYDQMARNADPVRTENYYVDFVKTMRHYSVPGCDMYGDAKAFQSIADLYSRPRVWIEAFHSSGWGQTLEDIYQMLTPWYVNGSTLYNPHAIYYSIHGSYWEWAPPDTGWRQPYFKHNRVLADYVSRLSYIMSQGQHVVHVGLIRPAKTLHGYTGFGSGADLPGKANRLYWALHDTLKANHIDYIILDEDSIHRAQISKDGLSINGIDLRVIILPDSVVLAGDTVTKLAAFAVNGGRCIVLGTPPSHAADQSISPAEFTRKLGIIKSSASRTSTIDTLTEEILSVVQRDIREPLPVLHRKIGNRDFYFIQTNTDVKPNGRERFNVNTRDFWKTDGGLGKQISLTLNNDGIPEMWDSISGKILPIYNYERNDGHTRVDTELADTSAPLLALRPTKGDEPLAIISDLKILGWERNDDEVVVRGIQRIVPGQTSASKHSVSVRFEDASYEGTIETAKPTKMDIPGPLQCSLLPTCDNSQGCFAWPPSNGPIPVEIRAMRFHAETDGDTDNWTATDYDDSQWKTVLASFGPRAEYCGPLTLGKGENFKTIKAPPKIKLAFKPVVYSLRLGVDEDRVFSNSLGGKGRIPEEFIDLGSTLTGDVYLVRTNVTLPSDKPVEALLRVGSSSLRRAFLNGQEIILPGAAEAQKSRAPVTLQPGLNKLEIILCNKSNGRIRLFYQFLPRGGVPADPEWIWSLNEPSTGESVFSKTLDIPGKIKSAEMIVALGGIHKIRINDELVTIQGNFDPYFTSRAERYDIKKFLRQGKNRIDIEAHDIGAPVGMLLDGLVVLEDGSKITFISDESFMVGGPKQPARILSGPKRRYWGDPALMLLQPRPHPLPLAGWLADQAPPPSPFDKLTFSSHNDSPPAGWYRFRLPPGATEITFKTPGMARLYINSKKLSVIKRGGTYTAKLPNTNASKRIAALRIESIVGFEEGAALLEPITFKTSNGMIPYGSWDQLGLPHYSGGMAYAKNIEIAKHPSTRYILDLGRVRGAAEVLVNGKPCGIRAWHPFRFDLTDAARQGANSVEIHVFNTLGPHFAVGHPSKHVFENHTVSGIFGPVALHGLREVELRLDKTQ
jgi:alpha-L-rhamnosidase